MKIALLSVGSYLIIKAIISLLWQFNDKQAMAQVVRCSRLVVGGFIIFVGLFFNLG